MNHWAAKYIGMPYEPGARGPEKVDCWGLVYLVYAKEFGITLHEIPGVSVVNTNPKIIEGILLREAALDWEETLTPKEGCVVAMSRSRIMHHVGIYTETDGGLVIHARDGQNVIADTLRGLTLKGMHILKFYQYKSWPGS